MNKQEFLKQLRNGLTGLSVEEIEERVIFYSEMIDDRMEEGLSEEKAVAEIGSVDTIVSQNVGDIVAPKDIKENIYPKKKFSTVEIILLILGSPIWFSLLIAAIAVVFSLYISLWAVCGSFIICAISGIVAGIVFVIEGHGLTGMVMIATALICSGISIYLCFGCKSATQGLFKLVKKVFRWIKKSFVKEEGM